LGTGVTQTPALEPASPRRVHRFPPEPAGGDFAIVPTRSAAACPVLKPRADVVMPRLTAKNPGARRRDDALRPARGGMMATEISPWAIREAG